MKRFRSIRTFFDAVSVDGTFFWIQTGALNREKKGRDGYGLFQADSPRPHFPTPGVGP